MLTRQLRVTMAPVDGATNPGPALSRGRLFILSDVRLLREGLVLALSHQPRVHVVGSSALSVSPTDITEARPDVVLLDATKIANLGLSHSLREICPGVKLVAFGLTELD